VFFTRIGERFDHVLAQQRQQALSDEARLDLAFAAIAGAEPPQG
jgi:hypothetical protein